ncbi:MAG TPA: hypothetical protein VGM82_12795 [Gemmatimonadaceae bacterium]
MTVLRQTWVEAQAVNQWRVGTISALDLTGETEGKVEVATIKDVNGEVIYANGSEGWQTSKSN